MISEIIRSIKTISWQFQIKFTSVIHWNSSWLKTKRVLQTQIYPKYKTSSIFSFSFKPANFSPILTRTITLCKILRLNQYQQINFYLWVLKFEIETRYIYCQICIVKFQLSYWPFQFNCQLFLVCKSIFDLDTLLNMEKIILVY